MVHRRSKNSQSEMVSGMDCGRREATKATDFVDRGTSHWVLANVQCTAAMADARTASTNGVRRGGESIEKS